MFKNKAKKELFIFLFLSLFVVIFTFFSYFISKSNFLRWIWNYIDDILLYQYNYSKEVHDDDIVIIKIDDKTLNELQKWDMKMLSFSKELYGIFLEKIFEEYKASIVWIDIVFSNKSIAWEEDELKLKDVFEKYKDKIVIASRWDSKETPLCIYNNVQHSASEWVTDENRTRKYVSVYENYKVNNSCNWNIYEWNWSVIYWFPVEVYKKYLSINKIRERNYKQYLDKYILDIVQKSNKIIYSRFFHNHKKNKDTIGFKSYSLIDILNWEKIDLKNKIVLLWEVWTLFHDRHFSPISFEKKMSWVEFHANWIETLKQWIKNFSGNYSKNDQFIAPFLYKLNTLYVFIILIISTIIIVFFVIKFNTYISLITLIILFFIHVITWTELFATYWYIYPVFFFIYSLLIWFIVSYFYKYLIVDKQKKFIKKAFGLFVAPEIVNIISEDPSKLNLKWKEGNITIFFSDIADFTSISESMKAEDLFIFLNEYFALMTNILTRNKWTLDKYIWDSVMGFFNAPLPIENPEYMACKTAIEQQKAIKILNVKWSKILHKDLNVRIGINSWVSVHWNLWAKDNRINYTVIWDNVNLASRLEWINKQYWTHIIISDNVYEKIKDKFITRELDTIKVKWKSQKTKIYELISFKDKKIIEESILENYSKWLHFYYKWNYNKAIIEFEKNDDDIPSRKMVARCNLAKEWKINIVGWLFQMKEK